MRDRRRVKRGICQRCGRYGDTEWHHVFGGPLRRISERMGFVLELCRECHRQTHLHPGIALAHKQRLQREWEALDGHGRDMWLAMMHRSYLEE